MRIQPTVSSPLPPVTTSTSGAASVTLPILGGNIPEIPVGPVLSAIVKQTLQGQAVLELANAEVTVKSQPGLKTGDQVFVRLTNSGTNPQLELLEAAENKTPSIPEPPAESFGTGIPTARVQVLKQLPNDQVLVQLQGKETIAQSEQPLQPGATLIVQVERSGNEVRLKPLSNPQQILNQVTTTLLRENVTRPPIGESIQQVFTELANRTNAKPTSAIVSEQATASVIPSGKELPKELVSLRESLLAVLPKTNELPNAQQLARFVQEGGLQYEAKLNRQVSEGKRGEAIQQVATHDLKAHLLRAVGTQPETANAMPEIVNAVQGLLDNIESLQALNVIAQTYGEPLQLQIPIFLGQQWQTVQMAFQADRDADRPDSYSADGYDLMMHLEFSEFGQTWIDTRITGRNISTIFFVETSIGQERLANEMNMLKTALQSEGFQQVLLDVRSTTELPIERRRTMKALQDSVPQSVSLLDVTA